MQLPQLAQLVAPGALAYVPAAHGLHVVFDVAEHAADICVPARQTLQAWHAPPLAKNPGGQEAHCVGAGPEHSAQLGSHAAQTVFAVEVHAVTS